MLSLRCMYFFITFLLLQNLGFANPLNGTYSGKYYFKGKGKKNITVSYFFKNLEHFAEVKIYKKKIGIDKDIIAHGIYSTLEEGGRFIDLNLIRQLSPNPNEFKLLRRLIIGRQELEPSLSVQFCYAGYSCSSTQLVSNRNDPNAIKHFRKFIELNKKEMFYKQITRSVAWRRAGNHGSQFLMHGEREVLHLIVEGTRGSPYHAYLDYSIDWKTQNCKILFYRYQEDFNYEDAWLAANILLNERRSPSEYGFSSLVRAEIDDEFAYFFFTKDFITNSRTRYSNPIFISEYGRSLYTTIFGESLKKRSESEKQREREEIEQLIAMQNQADARKSLLLAFSFELSRKYNKDEDNIIGMGIATLGRNYFIKNSLNKIYPKASDSEIGYMTRIVSLYIGGNLNTADMGRELVIENIYQKSKKEYPEYSPTIEFVNLLASLITQKSTN